MKKIDLWFVFCFDLQDLHLHTIFKKSKKMRFNIHNFKLGVRIQRSLCCDKLIIFFFLAYVIPIYIEILFYIQCHEVIEMKPSWSDKNSGAWAMRTNCSDDQWDLGSWDYLQVHPYLTKYTTHTYVYVHRYSACVTEWHPDWFCM